MSTWLLQAQVWHRRLRPAVHEFRYPLYCLRFPLSRQRELAGPLLSLNRPNLLSLYDRDHGPRDGSPLLPWIRALLQRHGLGCADGEIWLQTMPRVLGYGFNPVSFWFCEDREGRLRAALCEVNNTFGEHHNYLVAHPEGRPISPDDWLSAEKLLHVSPFCRPQGSYRFRFDNRDGQTQTRIDYDDGTGPLLQTAIHGRAQPLTSGRLLTAFITYPWLTAGVWLRIHWQAARLWLKGTPFYGKAPTAPEIRDER